jgi:hypothetical protein
VPNSAVPSGGAGLGLGTSRSGPCPPRTPGACQRPRRLRGRGRTGRAGQSRQTFLRCLPRSRNPRAARASCRSMGVRAGLSLARAALRVAAVGAEAVVGAAVAAAAAAAAVTAASATAAAHTPPRTGLVPARAATPAAAAAAAAAGAALSRLSPRQRRPPRHRNTAPAASLGWTCMMCTTCCRITRG